MKTLSKERLNELKILVGQWAENNFKVHAPAIGILEEIGEAAHCILKRKQGIRGFDDEEFFKKELKDAIADIAIYCFHEASLKNVDLYISEVIHGDAGSEDENLLSALAGNASFVLSGMSCYVNEVLDYAFGVAEHYGIDFAEAVEETWAKVSRRDWKKNPTDAHAQPIELNGDESLNFFAALVSEPRDIPPALNSAIKDAKGLERWVRAKEEAPTQTGLDYPTAPKEP